MTIHHPSEDLLFDYAAGSLPEPVALAVAGHAAHCAGCQRRIREIEDVGGAALETAETAALSAHALDAVMARLDAPAEEPAKPEVTAETRAALPSPLWPYVGGDIGKIRWKRKGKGIETADVPLSCGGYSAHLLRIQPGHSVPVHTHRGTEYTLVLKGAYHDGAEHYAAGDLQVADASLNHQPVADPGEVCLCLAVLDEPLRFTGPVARYLNPFIRL